jgi:hypothetical protein
LAWTVGWKIWLSTIKFPQWVLRRPMHFMCSAGLNWETRSASIAGARILADLRGETIEAFSKAVLDATHQKIADAILGYAFAKQTGTSMDAFSTTLNRGCSAFSCRFKLEVPIVGIGAAARHLLPEVANRLHTQAIFPSHFEVGNAWAPL